jgi:hypothetical protein
LNYKIFFLGIFVLLISSSFIFAQNKKKYEINTAEQYDSLVYKALALFEEPRARYNLDAIPTEKCGLSIQFEIHRRREELSQKDKDVLSDIFSKEVLDASVLSTKGNFRIHFNTAGPDAPDLTDNDRNGIPDYIDSVAYYFEYSLDALTNKIGIELDIKEICDNDRGEYNIYILNLSHSTYGYTEYDFDNLISKEGEVPRYSSSIIIDNNFNGLYTSGINGMKVTAVHEFFHAIQIGKFGLWGYDIYFYEMLSTWSESFVFPDVKDYYQYLNTYFNSTNVPFWMHRGYDMAIWGIFLEQKFSANIMKTILDNSKQYSPMQAIDVSLRQYNSSFSKEFAEFSNWVFFTGYRAQDNAYFKDAKNYPVVFGNSVSRIQYNLTVTNFNTSLRSYSTQYCEFAKGNDTINIISVHTNDKEAFEKNAYYYGLSIFQIAPEINDSRAISLMDDLQLLCDPEFPTDLKNFYLINHQYYDTTNDDIKAFPNPLHLSNIGTGRMSFNVPTKTGDEAELFVFSSNMRLIYQNKQIVKSVFMKPGIEWDCVDLDNKIISSGIYFYVIKANGKEWKNKFAVIKKK